MTMVTRLHFSPSQKIRLIILMIITIIGICKNAQGQATLPLSRTTWNAGEPAGWTNSGCAARTTTFACTGSNGTIFDTNGDSRTVFFSSAPDQLVFKLKSSSMSGASSLLVEESADGTTWSSIGNYGTAGGATAITDCANITITLNCLSRYVKWTYTKSSGNCDMDDVSISSGTCGCVAPADPSGTISGTTPACTNTTLSYSTPSATIYWQTSATGTSTTTATTSNLVVSTSGNYYVRAFDGTCWSTNSVGPYAVVINTAVAITTQPATTTLTVCSGTAFAALSVAATGTSLTYQWYSNSANSNSGGTLIGGATSASYTPPNATAGTTYYYCIVSGASPCSAVTSNVSGPRIVNQTPTAPNAPTPAANPGCSSTTLTTNAAPAGVTFYWQGTTSGGTSTGSPTSSAYTVSATGTYYVRAQDDVNLCWSTQASVAVTINTPVTITTHPTDKTVCTGNNTSMAIVGAGAAPKQWQFSTDGGATFNNVVADGGISTNFTTATMSLTNPPIGYNGYIYQCVVSVAGCPTVTSNTASLTVQQTPAAPSNPVAAANPACSGTSLNTMVPPAGVTWYWQGTTNPGTSTAVSTASIDNITASGTYYVRARTDGTSCWSTTSGSLAVTINTPPTISAQPASVTQCVGANATYSVTATGTSLTYQWQLDAGGGFGNLSNDATYSGVTAATLTVTGVTAGMNGYLYRCIVSGASPCAAATSSSASLVITASGTPTVAASAPATSNVGCNGFTISWTNGNGSNRLVVLRANNTPLSPTNGVDYTADAMFGVGSNLGSNSYVVYEGTGSSVLVYGLNASTTYEYRIFEFNGCSFDYLTSGTIPGASETTTSCSSPAGFTALYVDACGTSSGCGYEGNNELIWGVSGSYNLPITTNSPIVHYGGSSNPTVVKISTYAANPTNTSVLNTAVGACGTTTFIEGATTGFIPPNSTFLFANNCLCDPAPYDLSNLCGSGPVYVFYGTNAAWPCNTTGGIFGNHSGTNPDDAFFDLDFSSTITGLDNEYDYDKYILASGDGSYVTFDPAGGSATAYETGGCTVPLIVLPIELKSFYGVVKNDLIQLNWETISENNFNHFEIEKSKDAVSYYKLATVFSTGKNNGDVYSIIDEVPNVGINYYRIYSVDNDGKRTYQSTTFVNYLFDENDMYSIIYENDKVTVSLKEVNKWSELSLYNITGQLIKQYSSAELQSGKVVFDNSTFVKGMYIIRVNQKLSSSSDKIIIR